jgi:hypothetical protein
MQDNKIIHDFRCRKSKSHAKCTGLLVSAWYIFFVAASGVALSFFTN